MVYCNTKKDVQCCNKIVCKGCLIRYIKRFVMYCCGSRTIRVGTVVLLLELANIHGIVVPEWVFTLLSLLGLA